MVWGHFWMLWSAFFPSPDIVGPNAFVQSSCAQLVPMNCGTIIKVLVSEVVVHRPAAIVSASSHILEISAYG